MAAGLVPVQTQCLHMTCFTAFAERVLVIIRERMCGHGTRVKFIKEIALTMGSFKHSQIENEISLIFFIELTAGKCETRFHD